MNLLQHAQANFDFMTAPLVPEFSEGYTIIRPGVIQGHWNEDNSTFEITCPVQLQNALVELLNNLDYLKLVETKRSLKAKDEVVNYIKKRT